MEYLFFYIAPIVVSLLLAVYLSFEFKIELNLFDNNSVLFFIPILVTIGLALSFTISGILGNFLQHAIAGGVVVAFIGEYLRKTIYSDIKLRLWVILTMGLVSILGIGNELLEFFAQYFLGIKISETVLDTWYDLLANSIGGLFGCLLIIVFNRFRKQQIN